MEGHYQPVTGFQNKIITSKRRREKDLTILDRKLVDIKIHVQLIFILKERLGNLSDRLLKIVEDSSLVKVLYSYAAINTSRVDHKKIAATLHNRS